ncbi:glycine zipper 2TM domain-containing protein [Tsuneonella sp. YG55]|jgi:outer membrane lipoprotein SlyB|uniref:17 kDa surface antigen n=1 Tax=Tsuneonella litorea TaxID=2976475 RepID=A0A9X2W2M1_9SPHN|nr:glycine zipper 2TM domain-containing protein [Tsuneonella litorea]MCT2559074.1 glycine zipper 2TM domain-containing protein [Tsuneonella litorea]
MNKFLLAVAATSMAVPAAPTLAHNTGYSHRHYTSDNGVQYWQGRDGRYYCKKSNGTVGLVVGAAAGALVGRAIDTRGERATGTILGAAAGALLGREVQRRTVKCR